MIRMLIGWILLILGALDLWRFGWHLLLSAPQLIIGIVLVAIGGGLVGGGRLLGGSRRNFLP